MKDWDVFQRDVLDVLRQYEGFFDFFERVGSLSDDSRPDCFARITRENKKEIWVIDAKNKSKIDFEDKERMEKYISMLKANPIDAGLELGELSEYKFRGLFVTAREEPKIDDYETVKFKAFHQLLQKELVYTDTDKVVRDLSKMIERKQLSQSQARLLFNSVKPYEKRLDKALNVLKNIETEYIGLEVKNPPLSSYDIEIPVDAVVTHEGRDEAFLFDTPYSWNAVKNVDNKVEEVKKRLENLDKQVFYASINTFREYDSEYVLQPEEVENEIMETAGIVSPDKIAELFTPKVKTEKEYTDKGIKIQDKHGFGFKLEVRTQNDIKHSVKVVLPEKAPGKIKESMINSRKRLGRIEDNVLYHELEVTEDFQIIYNDMKESFEAYKDSVNSLYSKSVNPELGKKVNAV